jgi:hypothetical protein
MDWSKYPLDKLFYFVAAIIPGLVALLIFQLAVPGSFNWFFALGFLGYRTKLSLIVLVAFVVGNSVTTFLRGSIGAMYGALDAVYARRRPYTPPESYTIAPWRDPRWRTVLMRHLGTRAPKDTTPILPDILETRRKMAELLPSNEQPRALSELNSEKLAADMADLQWEQWYDHYHRIVLRPDDRDSFFHVGYNLRINLEAAALYGLVSAMFVPRLRHWWCILPSCIWVLMLVAEEYSAVQNRNNKWTTLSTQIKYLFETKPVE